MRACCSIRVTIRLENEFRQECSGEVDEDDLYRAGRGRILSRDEDDDAC